MGEATKNGTIKNIKIYDSVKEIEKKRQSY